MLNRVYFFIVLLITNCESDYLYPSYPSTSTLPEIIINKNTASSSGYVYPVPQQPLLPPLQDELPPAIEQPNNYLPPAEIPSNDLLPPQHDYLPPSDFPPVVPPVYGVPVFENTNFERGISPHVRVISMSCLDSTHNRFFRATIQSTDFYNAIPVLVKSNGCHLAHQSNDIIMLNLDGVNVADCGVRYCADKKMCLNLRIPTVKGLKLPEDRVISLQCIPQSSVASVVKSLGIKTQVNHARTRSLGTIATGGVQRLFEPHIAIYRRGIGNGNNNYEFNQLVEPGSAVVLGEELMLKASVKESDGWNFLRIGAVIMQQGIQQSKTRKSVSIVDNNGCRLDSMRAVCPEHPRQLSNRITIMPFRAFLFQDGDSDEMLLSVRLFGCMHHEDCQAKFCSEEKANDGSNTGSGGRNIGRRKRQAINNILDLNPTDNSTIISDIKNLDGEPELNRHNAYNQTKHKIPTMLPNETISRMNNDKRSMNNVQDYESHLDFRVVFPLEYNSTRMKVSNYKMAIVDDNEISLTNFMYNGYLIVGIILIAFLCWLIIYIVIKRLVMNQYNQDFKECQVNKKECVYDYFQNY